MPSGPSIGSVRLENPLVLAPMAGVTDLPFRLLCKEQGCALMFTEMVSDLAYLHGSRQTAGIITLSESERPVGVQLCGSDPGALAAAAARLEEEVRPDLIDINMGCPAPKIVKNREGAALMRDVVAAATIVRAVCDAVSRTPVTVKIRKGWSDDQVNAVEVACAVVEAGAAAVTVHGRVRTQHYSGVADWDIIRRVKLAVRVPVIGNGDVRDPASALRMMDETGCDAVMIGRAAMGNPWVFSACRAAFLGHPPPTPPTLRDRVAMAARHLDMLVAFKGERSGTLEMRRHAPMYIRGIRGAATIRAALVRARTAAEMRGIIEDAGRQDAGHEDAGRQDAGHEDAGA
jgi:tRNA-dihydrouridine synthase B